MFFVFVLHCFNLPFILQIHLIMKSFCKWQLLNILWSKCYKNTLGNMEIYLWKNSWKHTWEFAKIVGCWPVFPKFIYQFSSVSQSCPTLCDPMNLSTPGLPVHHQLPEFTQTHAHRVGDAIQPSHPLLSPSPSACNPSQHQGLFQWVNSSHQVAKVLEFQLQHQSFQWTPRTDLL